MNRSTITLLIIMAAALAVVLVVHNTPERTLNPRTEHCERSWANSATKQYGGSKAVFINRCREDLETLRGAR